MEITAALLCTRIKLHCQWIYFIICLLLLLITKMQTRPLIQKGLDCRLLSLINIPIDRPLNDFLFLPLTLLLHKNSFWKRRHQSNVLPSRKLFRIFIPNNRQYLLIFFNYSLLYSAIRNIGSQLEGITANYLASYSHK